MNKKECGIMLLRFRFKNYKSFAEEATLDMTASSIKDHQNSLITINKIDILPVASIFGANASGKSNLIDALKTMRKEVMTIDTNNEYNYITPYYFDDDYRNQPSEFEVSIYLKNQNKEYRYGFSKTNNEVYEEWLFSKTFSNTPSVKEKCVFYREKNKKIVIEINNQEEKKEILFINSLTKNNELLLTNLGKRETTKYSDIYSWFIRKNFILDFSDSNETFGIYNQQLLKALYMDKKSLQPIEDLVRTIDPSIKQIEIKEDIDSNMNAQYRVFATHLNSKGNLISVPFASESCGSKKLFSLALFIHESLNYGVPLLIDELDSKLHPLVLRYIIKLYHDKDINKGNGQIIFSSHNLICLDSSDLRRDEIWFVEKNNEKSTMFSLYDFKEETIRKDLDFGKHYLNGRFGAIPFIEGE